MLLLDSLLVHIHSYGHPQREGRVRVLARRCALRDAFPCCFCDSTVAYHLHLTGAVRRCVSDRSLLMFFSRTWATQKRAVALDYHKVLINLSVTTPFRLRSRCPSRVLTRRCPHHCSPGPIHIMADSPAIPDAVIAGVRQLLSLTFIGFAISTT